MPGAARTMIQFLNDLQNVTFLQNALLTGLLTSVACGVVGTYVVARRITYLAGGIAHCVLGGIGAAVYLQKVHHVAWLGPLSGAVIAALVAAGLIGLVSLRFKQREDTLISAFWAVGMAAGVLFLSQTPGYQQDLVSYLFGNILMVSRHELYLIAALDALVILTAVLFHKEFLAVCFDEEFARTRGIRVEWFYLLLMCMTALTVVLLVTVVGSVMVIALLTLPVAMAGQFARRMWQMMVLAMLLSAALTTSGLAVSYAASDWNLPTGATTVALAAVAYLIVLAGGAIRGRLPARPRNNPGR